MTRSRRSAKNAGTLMESRVAAYLSDALDDDRIERRARNGAKDRGDISGVRTALGERVVIEVKDYAGQIKAAEWVREAQVEAFLRVLRGLWRAGVPKRWLYTVCNGNRPRVDAALEGEE